MPTWLTTLLLTLTYHALIVGASLGLPVLAPFAGPDLAADPGWIGYYASVIFATATFSSLLSVGFIQRLGSIRTCQCSLVAAAAGLAVIPVGSLAALALSGALIGLAYGPVNPAASPLLARHTPERLAPLVFSIKQTSVSIGGAAAGLLFPAAAIAFGWQQAAGAWAALCLGLAVALQAWRRSLDTERDPIAPIASRTLLRPLRTVVEDAELRSLAIAITAFSMAQFGVMAIYVTYLWRQVGLSPTRAGAALSLVLTMSTISRIALGWASARHSPRRITALLAVAAAAAYGLTALVAPSWSFGAILALSALIGATGFGWSGVMMYEVARSSGPGLIAAGTAGVMTFAYVGALAGPAMFSGLLTATGSYRPAFVAIAMIVLIPALVLVRRRAGAFNASSRLLFPSSRPRAIVSTSRGAGLARALLGASERISVDLGVTLGELLEKDMVAVKLGADIHQVAVASPAYLARHGTPATRPICMPTAASTGASPAAASSTIGSS